MTKRQESCSGIRESLHKNRYLVETKLPLHHDYSPPSKGLYQSIGFAAINHELKKNRETCNANDYIVHMCRTIDPIILPSDHLIIDRMHSIHFSCLLKDRGNGRGNRKG